MTYWWQWRARCLEAEHEVATFRAEVNRLRTEFQAEQALVRKLEGECQALRDGGERLHQDYARATNLLARVRLVLEGEGAKE